MVAVGTGVVTHVGLPPLKVPGTRAFVLPSGSTFNASRCHERTAGPAVHTDTAPLEEHPWSPGPSLKPHVSPALDPPPSLAAHKLVRHANPVVPASKPALSLRVARSARRYLAGGGGNRSCATPAGPREANWVQAYTRSASAGTRCGLEMRAGSASAGCTPLVSQRQADRWRSGARVPRLPAVIMRSCSKLEASMLWVVSPAARLALAAARSAQVVLCQQPSNPSLQGTVQQRRCRCRPAPELWRWAAARHQLG